MKELELMFTLIVITFILIVTLNHLQFTVEITHQKNEFLERFYTGRFIIKNITEAQPFANGICNLTKNFFYLTNQTNFSNYVKEHKIFYPVELEVDYLNGTRISKVGGVGEDYIEFRRVCNYDGKLVLIRLRI